MTLQFDQTLNDNMEFNFYYHWSRPSKKESRIINSVLPVLAFIVLIYLTKGLDFEQYGLAEVLLLGFGIITGIFMGKIVRWNSNRQVKKLIKGVKNIDAIGKQSLTLNTDFLIQHTENSYSEIKWQAIDCMEENDNYFFLFLAANQAILIPKRIFSSESEIAATRELLINNLK